MAEPRQTTLTLAWRDRRAGEHRTPRRFLDFVVEGRSLYERHGLDFVSPLGWLAADEDEQAARRLLGDEPPDVERRYAVYVCPECGDVGCGAVTALVEHDTASDVVIWRDFAVLDWEGAWTHDRNPLGGSGELRLAGPAYRRAITNRPRR